MKSPVYILYDDDHDDVDNEVVNRPLARLWECSQSGVQNNKIVLQKRKFLLFCPPVWLYSHRRARGQYSSHHGLGFFSHFVITVRRRN